MHYRKEIDGLRAIAVIPVILFHAGFSAFSGGFIGVDVFFVISGYLITSLILLQTDENKFTLTGFYQRRARRILPALFLMMAVCIPFAWILMDPFELKEFGQSIISTVTFSSNIFFQMKTGYFDTANELKPLLHTWSLAVEEQYYIIFPLLITLIYRFGRKALITFLIITAILSLGLAHWGAYHATSFTFYSLPTRMWEILCGSLVSIYFQRHNKIIQRYLINQIFSLLGIALIFCSIVLFDTSTPFPSLFALLPTVGTMLVIVFTQPRTIAYRALTNPAMVFIGLISYSAYLWHQPLLAMARIYTLDDLSISVSIVCILTTFVLAYLTKLTVEDYFRFLLPKKNVSKILISFPAAGICLIAFGVVAHIDQGFPSRSKLGLQLAQNFGLSDICSGAPLSARECRTGQNPTTLLWGDSYAMHIGKALNSISKDGMIQATLSGCPPIAGYSSARRKSFTSCEEFNNSVLSYLRDESKRNIHSVVVSSSFDKFTSEKQEAFSNTLQQLKTLGLQVYIVSPPPINRNTLKCIKLMDRQKGSLADCSYDVSKIKNLKTLETLAKISKETGSSVIDLRKLVCNNNNCVVQINDTLMYRDNGHFSGPSAQIVSDFLKKQISGNDLKIAMGSQPSN